MTSVRTPSEFERRLFDKMMECDFAGRDSVRDQLSKCRVRELYENGGLEITTESPLIATVTARIPVEGEVQDIDGIVIHYLLHVVEGVVCELEVYKEDNSRIARMPDVESIDMWGCC